jgi:hypothetical protein
LVTAGVGLAGCSATDNGVGGNTSTPAANGQAAANSAAPGAPPAANSGTPAPRPGKNPQLKNVTNADLAKIKWLNGSFKGTGGTPFYNKYAWNGTTLNIESYNDEAMTKQSDKSVLELKDGVFGNTDGKDRFVASEIKEDHLQLVTATEKYAVINYDRQPDGTIKATFEYAGDDNNPHTVSYILEPLKK